jgi:hypothetical protein
MFMKPVVAVLVSVVAVVAFAGAPMTLPSRDAYPADSNVANGTPPPLIKSIDPDPSTVNRWQKTEMDVDRQPIHPKVGGKSNWESVRRANFTQTRDGVEHREVWFEFPDGSIVVQDYPNGNMNEATGRYLSSEHARKLTIVADWWWFPVKHWPKSDPATQPAR